MPRKRLRCRAGSGCIGRHVIAPVANTFLHQWAGVAQYMPTFKILLLRHLQLFHTSLFISLTSPRRKTQQSAAERSKQPQPITPKANNCVFHTKPHQTRAHPSLLSYATATMHRHTAAIAQHAPQAH